jgi:hypothetical protein
MKIKLFIFATSLFFQFFFIAESFCQTVSTDIRNSTIQWNAYEFLNTASNQYVENDSYFISYGEEKIEWYQQEGGVKETFSVTSCEGNWKSIAKAGSVKYNIMFNGNPGTIQFKRDGDWITIRLNLNGLKGDSLTYEFSITNFELK